MERYDLDTPEAIQISYDVAGIGNRFLAAAIDTLIVIGALIVVGLGSLGIGALGGIGQSVGIIAFVTLSFVLLWGYYIVFETVWSGQTPGKRVLGIRVIKTSGYPIQFSESAIRNLVRLIDFLPSLYGIGVVVMFLSPRSRRLGDYAAGTLVIKERIPVAIRDLAAPLSPGVTSGPATTSPPDVTVGLVPPLGTIDPEELAWDLGALTPHDLQVARAYLERVPSLPADTRDRIGREIAGRLAPRVGAREPYDPVAFLRRIVYLQKSG